MFFIVLPVQCSFLRLENGEVSYNTSPVNGSFPANTTASFSCNSHYRRDGPSSVTCQISGNWTEETPTCNASNGNDKFVSSMLTQTYYFVTKFVIYLT